MSATTEYLEKRGVPFEVIAHEKVFTSIAEAKALGIDADDVVKTLLVDAAEGRFLAVVPGDRRLDMKLVEAVLGDKHAHLAKEEELEAVYPEFELGALPPLGGLLHTHAYVDPDVMRHETVVFAGGTQTESIKARTADVFRDEPITVTKLTQTPADEYV